MADRHAYPLMLDVTDRLVVVVGGGAVAARKVAGLLAAGARRVRVVAPTLHPDLAGTSAIEVLEEVYSSRHLEGATLVFAATDSPDVNAAVVRDARARGALVNRSDAPADPDPATQVIELSDFATPAVHRQGPLMLSVSTGGAPALAAKVRDELVLRLDPRWVELAEATEALRPLVVGAKSVNAGSRRAVLRELASDAALSVLAESGRDGLRRWLEEHLAALSAEDRTVTGLTPNGAGKSDCTTAEDASGTD